MRGQGGASFELHLWAKDNNFHVIKLAREDFTLPLAPGAFPYSWRRPYLFCRVEMIDEDSVYRGAPALAYYRGGLINDYPDQAVEVVWLSSRQLDRRDLPRRASSVAGPKAQGWYADPTGRHELRWFSVGRPTYLVRDGAVEGRDEQLMED